MKDSIYEVNPFKLFDDLIEDAFFSVGPVKAPNKVNSAICSSAFPPADVFEDASGDLNIELAVAGYKEHEIAVEYEANYLKVLFKKDEDTRKKVYIQRAIKSVKTAESSFFVDPTRYDANKIAVHLEDGVLSIVVSRNEQLAKNRLVFGNLDTTKSIESTSEPKNVSSSTRTDFEKDNPSKNKKLFSKSKK